MFKNGRIGTFGVMALAMIVSPAVAASQRPNILFIMADDHAYHALSSYESRLIETPNLDQLADEGVRFDRAFVRTSLCTPSRATILTGQGAHATGVFNNREPIPTDQPVVSERLQAAGYQTAVFGKWHLADKPRGFDHYRVLPGQGRYQNPVMQGPDGRTTIEGFTTDVITNRSMDWLSKQSSDQPFCMMVHFKAPHAPVLHFKDTYADRFTEDLPLPPTLQDDYATRIGPSLADNSKPSFTWLTKMFQPDFDRPRPKDLDEPALRRWMYQHYFQAYLRHIACIDDNVGRLLDALQESGLSEETVVVYTSDNGFFLGDHGWYNKMWMYEQSMRIPLLVRWPSEVEGGRVSERLVSNVDFAPTFLALAEAEPLPEAQGRSLLPLLKGEKPETWREAVYYDYQQQFGVPTHYGVRTRRYKLIHYPKADGWELFDLQKDPNELNNRYNAADLQSTQKRLKQTLKRLRKRFEARRDD
jgi:arylsulfatase A-like enzyme